MERKHLAPHRAEGGRAVLVVQAGYMLYGTGECRGNTSSHNPASWYTVVSFNGSLSECEATSDYDTAMISVCIPMVIDKLMVHVNF